MTSFIYRSLLLVLIFSASATLYGKELPELRTKNGKHALFVDGQPFLMLAAQANNSSNYAAALEKVWPVVHEIQANTLEINVAWEQVEPREGQFDFSFVDTLIKQARQHDIKLVLLWFATWKNNAPHYAPAWVKLDNARFPRVEADDGRILNSLSPHFKSTLNADKKAFVALMKHLKKVDKHHQVIMVQVQNEVGTYGSVRDFSTQANSLFSQPVPKLLRDALALPDGNWSQAFGSNASEFFHAYSIARYCNEIAEAGKVIHPLPMTINVALRNPFNPGKPGSYSSGGATDNVIDIWKIAAPAIDIIAPDIYFRDYRTATKILDIYARDDNPLFVAEIGNDQPYARYLFETLGRGGIGIAPFGMDTTGYTNYPLGAKGYRSEDFAPFAEVFALLSPWAHQWAKISYEYPVWGVAEPVDTEKAQAVWNSANTVTKAAQKNLATELTQVLDLGLWNAEVTYGRPMFWIDPPKGNNPASGGALVAKLSENSFLVTGLRSRVTFMPSSELSDKRTMIVRVEEGHFSDKGKWVFERVWNGDQTDWGLNFDDQHHLLKITMATY